MPQMKSTVVSAVLTLCFLSSVARAFVIHPPSSTLPVCKSSYKTVVSNSKTFLTKDTAKDIRSATFTTYMSTSDESNAPENEKKSNLPMLLDPGTKGGAIFLGFVLAVVPLVAYNVATINFGIDEIDAGRWFGVGFTVVACLGWASTYIFRVATKDMTYAKQLKDYENAVIAKRLEELDEDEVQALVEDIERDDF